MKSGNYNGPGGQCSFKRGGRYQEQAQMMLMQQMAQQMAQQQAQGSGEPDAGAAPELP